MKQNKVNILYQINDKYAPFAGVSMTSLLKNNSAISSELVFYILGEELSEQSIVKFRRLEEEFGCDINIKDGKELINWMRKLGLASYRGSFAANLRLFLPQILEEDVERVLYLDADTVVNAEIDKLYFSDLEENAVGMVLDSLGEKHKLELGLKKEEPYYNSGVVLFDMIKWRQYGYTQKIIEFIKEKKEEFTSPDQDLLNIVCKGHIMTLPPEYNMQPVHIAFSSKDYKKYYRDISYYSEEEINKAVKQPVIYHFFRFLGEFPWNKKNCHPDNELFDRYLRESPWKDYRKEKAQASIFNKIEKVLYFLLPGNLFLGIFHFAHNLYLKQKAEISN